MEGLILTHRWEDRGDAPVLHLWGTGQEGPFHALVQLVQEGRPYFFIDQDTPLEVDHGRGAQREKVGLQNFAGRPVDRLSFGTQHELEKVRERLRTDGMATYESDLKPAERFLMERFICGSVEVTGESHFADGLRTFHSPAIKKARHDLTPPFKILSLDIETGPGGELYSLALHITGKDQPTEGRGIVLMGGKAMLSLPGAQLEMISSEKVLLSRFFELFHQEDPDIIIGWNILGFDLLFLENKCTQLKVPFLLGRGRGKSYLHPNRGEMGYSIHLDGRVVVDGPLALRQNFFKFKNFKLETVARELLGKGKDMDPAVNKVKEVERRFHEDKLALAKYNLLDSVLVSEIFQMTQLLQLLLTRASSTGMTINKVGSSIAAFDFFYLPRLHAKGVVAPDLADRPGSAEVEGGQVLEPIPGPYEHIVVLDFKSLYPSIIRTFKIDPLSRIMAAHDPLETPVGISFSRSEHILPAFIEEMMEKREKAKKEGNLPLSTAIKIHMNSFYGVMGATGSRFYHPDLPRATAGTGRWVLREATHFLEKKGHRVIYGDTDSIFVDLNRELENLEQGQGEDKKSSWVDAKGRALAQEVNAHLKGKIHSLFNLTSQLELVFDRHFRKFFLPSLRKGKGGAKKRYAGLLDRGDHDEIQFTGLEFVRSDWTELAKKFQGELFTRLFREKEMDQWMRDFVHKLREGHFDGMLTYKKRLTKDLAAYTKTRPPHVKAALLLQEERGRSKVGRLREVSYIMTKRGPVPVELPHADIDYEHYVEKQLRPIADSVLSHYQKSFDGIMDAAGKEGGGHRQGSLF